MLTPRKERSNVVDIPLWPSWPPLHVARRWSCSTSSPHQGHVERSNHMTGRSVSAVTAYTAHREWASRPPDERYASVHALYEAARARHARIEERTIETGRFQDRGGRHRRSRHSRDVGSHRRIDALELRPARDHRQRAAKLPSDAARGDRIQCNQLRAAAVRSRPASAVRRADRTVDRARDHITAVCTRPPSRAGRPGARPHGPAPGLAPAARIQGRRVRRRTGSVRRLPGRPRHVSVPRGRQPRSRRPHGPHPRRSVPRIHSPEQ